MLFKNIHVILGRVVLAGKAGVPLPGRQHQYTWSRCLPAICLFSFASRVWLRTLVLKGTAAKPSINCNAESPGLAWRLLHESTSGGDPTMQQSVGSCAGGTHKELSKADPYSDDLVSRGFILSLKKKNSDWDVGKIHHRSFLTVFLLLRELCKNSHHIVFGIILSLSGEEVMQGVSTIFCCQG